MTRPRAYDPAEGQRFQIFTRYRPNGPEWEHCDYAKDRKERDYLLKVAKLAYGPQFDFKCEVLPKKYWPKKGTTNDPSKPNGYVSRPGPEPQH